MAMTEGNTLLLSDINALYTSFNTVLAKSNISDRLTTLSTAAEAQTSDLNNVDNIITKMKSDAYLGTQSSWWTNLPAQLTVGQIIDDTIMTNINSTTSHFSSVVCKNTAANTKGINTNCCNTESNCTYSCNQTCNVACGHTGCNKTCSVACSNTNCTSNGNCNKTCSVACSNTNCTSNGGCNKTCSVACNPNGNCTTNGGCNKTCSVACANTSCTSNGNCNKTCSVACANTNCTSNGNCNKTCSVACANTQCSLNCSVTCSNGPHARACSVTNSPVCYRCGVYSVSSTPVATTAACYLMSDSVSLWDTSTCTTYGTGWGTCSVWCAQKDYWVHYTCYYGSGSGGCLHAKQCSRHARCTAVRTVSAGCKNNCSQGTNTQKCPYSTNTNTCSKACNPHSTNSNSTNTNTCAKACNPHGTNSNSTNTNTCGKACNPHSTNSNSTNNNTCARACNPHSTNSNSTNTNTCGRACNPHSTNSNSTNTNTCSKACNPHGTYTHNCSLACNPHCSKTCGRNRNDACNYTTTIDITCSQSTKTHS